jgi:hypothetical protein
MIKQASIIASMLAALPAVGCTGIFTDRELPPLDARSDAHPDGTDGETEGLECPDGLIYCTGECVEPKTDRRHCGTCDNACEAVASCVGGICTCPSGFESCGGVCVDLGTDRGNCGICGNICDPDQVCSGMGICLTECGSGFTLCDAGSSPYCADTGSDPFNCGGCHSSCGPYMQAAAACVSSVCGLICDAGFGDANGQPADGCECAITSAEEICDAMDNDCDGNIDDGFACVLGMTQACTVSGTCTGSQVCQGPDCTWSDCMNTSWNCIPGPPETRVCCVTGTQSRSCRDDCTLSAWSDCSVLGECSPAAAENQACCATGNQTRTCQADCSWGGWGDCSTGECTPGEQYCNDGWSYVPCQVDCIWGNPTQCGTSPDRCCNEADGTCYAHTHPCP